MALKSHLLSNAGVAIESADIHKSLDPYRDLISSVDRIERSIRGRYFNQIACCKGCNCGCRNLSIFPIEAISLARALRRLPGETSAKIRQRAAAVVSFWDCPLLQDRACSMYSHRPIICRTHGYPLRTIYNGRPSIGHCRRNFKNMPTIPDDAIIDLDAINRRLGAINASFVEKLAVAWRPPDRLSISEAILITD